MPNQECENCHVVDNWSEISFDHNKTDFKLAGKHTETTCRSCHFEELDDKEIQHFANLSTQCENCHADVHHKQFTENGQINCERCHEFENWKAERFDHDQTRFKLEGAHVKVDCGKCHPKVGEPADTFIQYKLYKEIKCANCHS